MGAIATGGNAAAHRFIGKRCEFGHTGERRTNSTGGLCRALNAVHAFFKLFNPLGVFVDFVGVFFDFGGVGDDVSSTDVVDVDVGIDGDEGAITVDAEDAFPVSGLTGHFDGGFVITDGDGVSVDGGVAAFGGDGIGAYQGAVAWAITMPMLSLCLLISSSFLSRRLGAVSELLVPNDLIAAAGGCASADGDGVFLAGLCKTTDGDGVFTAGVGAVAVGEGSAAGGRSIHAGGD